MLEKNIFVHCSTFLVLPTMPETLTSMTGICSPSSRMTSIKKKYSDNFPYLHRRQTYNYGAWWRGSHKVVLKYQLSVEHPNELELFVKKTKCFLLFRVIKPKYIPVLLSHITSNTTYLEYNKEQAILMIKKNCAYIQERFVTQIYLIEYVSTNKVSGFNCTFIVNK